MESSRVQFLEVVKHLEDLGIMPKTKPGLEKIKGALLETDWFKSIDPKKVIVVAGTNGKGSTCAILESLFLHAGHRVGFYSSPHLVQTTERIRINGCDISEESFVQVFLKNKGLIEKHQLSHFESLTLMAGDVFFSNEFFAPLDFVIFEVGLGGTFDATNAFPHHWSVITKLGMDHVDILGPTLQDIARNKFGIVRNDSVVVHAPLDPAVHDIASEIQFTTKSSWTPAAEFKRFKQDVPAQLKYSRQQTPTFTSDSEGVTASAIVAQDLSEAFMTPWGLVHLNLCGLRAIENAIVALTLFSKMGFQVQDHVEALRTVRWPGRMQHVQVWLPLLQKRLSVFVSGDHNEQGINSLCEILEQHVLVHNQVKKLHLITGIGKDKDADTMLQKLSAIPRSEIYLTETPFKGRSLADYPEWIKKKASYSHAKIESVLGVVAARVQPESDVVILTGSLYLVGEVLKLTHAMNSSLVKGIQS